MCSMRVSNCGKDSSPEPLDGVPVLELAALHFFAVDEKTAALPAILEVKAVRFDDDGGAIARDAAVGELQVVAGFRAPADQERQLRDAHVAPPAVRRDDFKNGIFAWKNGLGHGWFPVPPL